MIDFHEILYELHATDAFISNTSMAVMQIFEVDLGS
jgi:hypothetical protein